LQIVSHPLLAQLHVMVEGGNGLRLQFDRMTRVSGEQYGAYGQE
jgi:hypothetical protein